MTTAGPNYASTAANDSAIGAQPWNTPSNALTSDASFSNVLFTTAPEVSYYLKWTDFGFAIPSDAIVTGVRVSYFSKASANDLVDEYSIRLVVGGVISGDDLAASDPWQDFTQAHDRGGIGVTWGLSLTGSDVNATDFGVVLSCSSVSGLPAGFVDYVELTVYCTDAPSDPPVSVPSSSAMQWVVKAPPRWSSRTRIAEHYPDYVAEPTEDVRTNVVRSAPHWLPTIVARTRIFGEADDFDEGTTPGWEPMLLRSLGLGLQFPLRKSRALLLDAPEGQGSTCCCPFGAVVIERRFATALVVAESADPFITDPITDPPVDPVLRPTAPNTADVVSDKFATALLIANVCHC